MHMVRLTYYSENRLDPIAGPVLAALQGILSTSKRNNAKRGITGALAFDSFWFFQALEGEREAVWTAFKRIMDDVRHGDVTLAACVPIETRLFGNWSMRLVMRNAAMEPLFEPFMVAGVLRPKLMSGVDIENALLGMTGACANPRAPMTAKTARGAEEADGGGLPGPLAS